MNKVPIKTRDIIKLFIARHCFLTEINPKIVCDSEGARETLSRR